MVLTVATLVSGCADDQDGTGRESGQRPSPPATRDRPASAPPIQFTADGFKYTFTATGAGLSPTAPANPSEPLPAGETYLVVDGSLTNLQADRPAPRFLVADIGVSIPLTALAAVITDRIGSGGRCENLTLPVGEEPARSLPAGRCLLVLHEPESPDDPGATIPAAGSVPATYVRRLPDKLPLNEFRLVGFQRGDRYTITSSHPVPWNPR